jgi:hypothetical protein
MSRSPYTSAHGRSEQKRAREGSIGIATSPSAISPFVFRTTDEEQIVPPPGVALHACVSIRGSRSPTPDDTAVTPRQDRIGSDGAPIHPQVGRSGVAPGSKAATVTTDTRPSRPNSRPAPKATAIVFGRCAVVHRDVSGRSRAYVVRPSPPTFFTCPRPRRLAPSPHTSSRRAESPSPEPGLRTCAASHMHAWERLHVI